MQTFRQETSENTQAGITHSLSRERRNNNADTKETQTDQSTRSVDLCDLCEDQSHLRVVFFSSVSATLSPLL